MSPTNFIQCYLKALSMYFFVSSLTNVDSANILAMFPIASYSHQKPQLALAKALAKNGHNVTVITPNPSRVPMSNYTEIDISFTYKFWNTRGKNGEKPLVNLEGKLGAFEALHMFVKASHVLADSAIGSPHVQNFIKYLDREKPRSDLVLYEELIMTAYLGFVHKLGYPPFISLTTLPLSCGTDMSAGNECNPSYVPDMVLSTKNKMNFWERLHNYFAIIYSKLIIRSDVTKGHNAIARKYFGSDCPCTESVAQNRSLHLSSSSWLFEYSRPVFPNTIHVGPLHIDPKGGKPLPQDLKQWIQGGKKGFIYLSFGSNVRSASLNEATRSSILAAFARFRDFRIIWKWEDEELQGLPSNTLCRKWLPQQDLLADPNIKLFITQGGLQSFQEAVHFAVPMITIPFFGDQNYNARIVKRLGIGTYLEVEDITEETLFHHIKEILNNEKYKKAVQRASLISQSGILSPVDTAVWWVEHVLKLGGNVDYLRPEYFHLRWYQFMGLDLAAAVVTPLLVFLYGVYVLLSNLRMKFVRDKVKMN